MRSTLGTLTRTPISIGLALLVAVVTMATISIMAPDPASAQQGACSPSTDFGLVTKTVEVPAAPTYYVWSRMKHADGNPTYTFHMDGAGGSSCDQAVSATGGANAWLWEQTPTVSGWSGGTATIHLSGNKAGVGLDCIVLTTDSGFAPSTADDCATGGDTTNPTITISTANNTIASTENFDVEVSASDETALDRVEFYVNGALDHTATSAPYTYSWNVRDASVPNADYQVTAKAIDSSQNEATSSATTIRVRHADVNRDNDVGIVDLSQLLGGWGDDDDRFDLNANGEVDLIDLSRLLGAWGT